MADSVPMEVIEHLPTARAASASARPPGWLERLLERPMAAWLILAASLVVTGLAWWVSRHYALDEARQRFERRGDEIQARLAGRIASYEALLRSGVAMFAASGEVTRHDWQRFFATQQPDRHYPGLQGYGVARLLRPDELATHEQAVRAEGFGDYAVRPAGVREAYSSIVYLEPFVGRNQRAFGFDMLSEPVRREAMLRARDRGEAAMTGAVTLVQDDGRDPQPGLLVYQPVYRSGSGSLAGEGAAATLWGWVYAPFRVNDLMEGLVGRDAGDIAIRVHDGPAGDPAAALYDSRRSGNAGAAAVGRDFQRQAVLNVGGRAWTVVYEAADFDSPGGAVQSNLVAAGGLTIDLLLFAAITLMARRKQLVEHEVQQRTDESQVRLAWLDAVSGLSPDGALVFERGADGPLRLVFTNPAFSRLFGLRPHDLLGLSEAAVDEWLEGLAHDDDPMPPLARGEALVRLAGPPARVLQRGMREDAQRRVYYFRDVTRESEVDRLKSEFLTTAAHELRTPLASVYGFAELLQAEHIVAERRLRAARIVYRQAGVLKHLVDELLDLARIDARAGRDFVRGLHDLRQIADEAAEAMLRPDEPLRIQVLPCTSPLWAQVDAAKLRQAVVNLLSNAVKYSPPNTPITLAALRERRGGREMAALRVADQGIGMTAEQTQRAFERFYRADPSGHVAGAGLGLSIVQQIVELHGGSVELHSTPDVGTQVTLWLPLSSAPVADAPLRRVPMPAVEAA